jgi:PhzF family phenazine biosynthesis protein
MAAPATSRTVTAPMWVADAFARRPFTGNPAAIVLLPEHVPDSILSAVADELQLSETAFIVPAGPCDPLAHAASRDRFHLRWFTPLKEVALCGHATLATAHVIFSEVGNTSQRFVLPFDRPARVLAAPASSPHVDLLAPPFSLFALVQAHL